MRRLRGKSRGMTMFRDQGAVFRVAADDESIRNSRPETRNRALKRARDFYDLVHLELVADLEIIEVSERKPAFEPGLDLAPVVLEALEGVEFAIVNHDVVAQNAHLGSAAPDQPLGHVTAGNSADLGDLEYL